MESNDFAITPAKLLALITICHLCFGQSSVVKTDIRKWYWSLDGLDQALFPMSSPVYTIEGAFSTAPAVRLDGSVLDGATIYEVGNFTDTCISNLTKCDIGYTVMVWFKPGANAGDYTVITSGADDPMATGFTLQYNQSLDLYQVVVSDNTDVYEPAFFSLNSSEWVHVAFNYHVPVGVVTVYVNGTMSTWSKSKTPRETGVGTVYHRIRIGGRWLAPIQHGNFLLDEILVYDTVFTEVQVQQMITTTLKMGSLTKLYWAFDESFAGNIVMGSRVGRYVGNKPAEETSGRYASGLRFRGDRTLILGEFPNMCAGGFLSCADTSFSFAIWVYIDEEAEIDEGFQYIIGNMDNRYNSSGFVLGYNKIQENTEPGEPIVIQCLLSIHSGDDKYEGDSYIRKLIGIKQVNPCLLKTWMHIAISRERVNMNVYINGQNFVTITAGSPDYNSLRRTCPITCSGTLTYDPWTELRIGNATNRASSNFVIDEFHFVENDVLYADEVAALGQTIKWKQKRNKYKKYLNCVYVIEDTLVHLDGFEASKSYYDMQRTSETICVSGITRAPSMEIPPGESVMLNTTYIDSHCITDIELCGQGVTIYVWLKQFGSADTNNKAHYLVTGADHPSGWGYALLSENGTLLAIVKSPVFEWKVQGVMGYNQWLFITISFHRTFGLRLMVNGLEAMSVSSPTIRVNPPYPGVIQPKMLYIGRGTYELGDRNTIILDGLVIKEGMTSPELAFEMYGGYTLLFPSPMDALAEGAFVGETPLYPMGDTTPLSIWQNPVYNFSVSLDGATQYLESMDIPYNCLLSVYGGECYGRKYLYALWWRANNITADHTLLWAGANNVPLLHVRCESGRYQVKYQRRLGQIVDTCVMSLPPINPGEWTHLSVSISGYLKKPTTVTKLQVNQQMVAMAFTCTSFNFTIGEEPVLTANGKIYIGAAPNGNGSVGDFGYLKVDEFDRSEGPPGSEWDSATFTAQWNCFDVMLSEYIKSYFNVTLKYEFVDEDGKPDIGYHSAGCNYPKGVDSDRAQTTMVHQLFGNRTVELEDIDDVVMDTYFTYALEIETLQNLIQQANTCHQEMEYFCFNAPVFESQYGPAYWVGGNDNSSRFFWGSADPTKNTSCACSSGPISNCSDPGKLCNCENTIAVWQSDVGNITDKQYLPIQFLSLPKPVGYSKWRVGPLECISYSFHGLLLTMNEEVDGCLNGDISTTCSEPPVLTNGIVKGSLSQDMANFCAQFEKGKSECLDGQLDNINGIKCPRGFALSLWTKVEHSSVENLVPVFSHGNPDSNLPYGITLLVNTTNDSHQVAFTIVLGQKKSVSTVTVTVAKYIWNHLAFIWHDLLKLEIIVNGKNTAAVGVRTETVPIANVGVTWKFMVNTSDFSGRLGCGDFDPMNSVWISIDDFRFASNVVKNESMQDLYAGYAHYRNMTSGMDGNDWLGSENTTFPLIAENTPEHQPSMVGNGTILNGVDQYLWQIVQYHCLGYLSFCVDSITFSVWLNIRHPVETKREIITASTEFTENYGEGFSLSLLNKSHWSLETIDGQGLQNVSVFTASWRRWVHFSFVMNVNGTKWTSLFLNGVEILAEMFNSSHVNTSVPQPPNTKLVIGSSASDVYTSMWLDDMHFHEMARSPHELQQLYLENLREEDLVTFDSKFLPFGGNYSYTSGARLVPGRERLGLLVPQGQNASYDLPLFHECIGNPDYCHRGFTVAFWFFPKFSSQGSTVTMISAEGAHHGIALDYNPANTNAPFEFRVFTSVNTTALQFFLPNERWRHLMFVWTREPQISMWANGSLSSATSTVNVVPRPDDVEGVILRFALDNVEDDSYFMVDEFRIIEDLKNETLASNLYTAGLQYQNPLHWPLDSILTSQTEGIPDENGLTNGTIPIVSAVNGTGFQFTAPGAWVQLTTEPFYCLNDIRLCVGLTVSLYVKYKGWVFGEDNYLIYNTDRRSSEIGFYFMHGNLEPRLPFRHYFQIGIQRDNVLWTVDLKVELDVWYQMAFTWSESLGLEITIDGVWAGQNNTGATWPTLEPNNVGTTYLGLPNKTHSANAIMDDMRYWDSWLDTTNIIWTYQLGEYYIGCYLGSPLTGEADLTVMTSGSGVIVLDCRRACDKEYRYALLSNSSCYCAHSLANGVPVSDGICDLPCGILSCGGSGGQLSVYRTTANLPFPVIYPITYFQLSILGKYSIYNTSQPVVDVNETFVVVPHIVGGNFVVYKIEYGDGSPIYYTESANWTYTYFDEIVYTLNVTAMNEHSEVFLSIPIKVTFPLFPIAALNINTSDVSPTNQLVFFDLTMSSGNDLTCNLTLIADNGYSDWFIYNNNDYNQKSLHMLNYTFIQNGLFFVSLTCENSISQGSSTTSIMVQEPVGNLSINPNWVYDSFQPTSNIFWTIDSGSHMSYRLLFSGNDVAEIIQGRNDVDIPQFMYAATGYFDIILYAWNNVSGPVNVSAQAYVEQGVSGFEMDINETLIKTGTCIKVTFVIAHGSMIDHVLAVDGSTMFSLHFDIMVTNYTNSTILCFDTPGVKGLYSRANNTVTTQIQTGNIMVLNPVSGTACLFTNVSQWQQPVSFIVSQASSFQNPTNMTFNITFGDGEFKTVSNAVLNSSLPLNISHLYHTDSLYTVTIELTNDVSEEKCFGVIQVGFPIKGHQIYLERNLYHTAEPMMLGPSISEGSNVNVTCYYGDGIQEVINILPALVVRNFTHAYMENGTYDINCTFRNDYGYLVWNDYVLVQELITGLTFTGPLLYEADEEFYVSWSLTSGSHIQYICLLDGVPQDNWNLFAEGGSVQFSGFPVGEKNITLYAYNNVTGTIVISQPLYVERSIDGLAVLAPTTFGEANVSYVFQVTMHNGSNVHYVVAVESINFLKAIAVVGDINGTYTKEFQISFPRSGDFKIEVHASNRHGNSTADLMFYIDNQIAGFELISEPGLDFHVPVLLTVKQSPLAPQPTTPMNLFLIFGDGYNGSWTNDYINSSMPFDMSHSYAMDGDFSVAAKLSNQHNFVWLTTNIRVGQEILGVTWSLPKYIYPIFESIDFQYHFINGTNVLATIMYSDGWTRNSSPQMATWEVFQRVIGSPGNISIELQLVNMFTNITVEVQDDIQVQVPIAGASVTPFYLYSIYTSVDISWNVLFGSHLRCAVNISGLMLTPSVCGPNVTYNLSNPSTLYSHVNIGHHQVEIILWNDVSGPLLLFTTVQVERDIQGSAAQVSDETVLPGEEFSLIFSMDEGSNINISVSLMTGEVLVTDQVTGDIVNLTRTYSLAFSKAGWYGITVTVVNDLPGSQLEHRTSVTVENPILGISMSAQNTSSFIILVPLSFTILNGTLSPSNTTLSIYLDDDLIDSGIAFVVTAVEPFHYKCRVPVDGQHNITAVLRNDLSTVSFGAYLVIGGRPEGIRTWTNKDTLPTGERFLLYFSYENGSDVDLTVQFGDGSDGSTYVKPGKTASLSHYYTTQGFYHVTFTMLTSIGQTRGEYPRDIYVEDRIEIRKVSYTGSLMIGEAVGYTADVSSVGQANCIHWDFGVGPLGRFVFGEDNCKNMVVERNASHIYWTIEDGEQHVMFSYYSLGLYSLTVTGSNRVSNSSVTLSLRVLPCKPPVAYFGGRGMTQRKAAVYHKAEAIRLRVHGKSNCKMHSLLKINCHIFNIFNESDTIVTKRPNNWLLKFPSRYFEYGLYKIVCTVSEVHDPLISSTATKYLRITKSPLVVKIKGGSTKNIGMNNELSLDVSGSAYDPDTGTMSPEGLTFAWYIRTNSTDGNYTDLLSSPPPGMSVSSVPGRRRRELTTRNRIQTWFNPVSDVAASGPIFLPSRHRRAVVINQTYITTLRFAAWSLQPQTYYFLVVVSKEDRTAEATQSLLVIPGKLPNIGIRCLVNCGPKVAVTSKLTLEAICDNCYTYTGVKWNYSWKGFQLIAENDPHGFDIHLKNKTASAPNSKYLVIKGNELQHSSWHYIEVRISESTISSVGNARYRFQTGLPPYGGRCDISPKIGVTTVTAFKVTCQGWIDEGRNKDRDIFKDKQNYHELSYTFSQVAEGDIKEYTLHYGVVPEVTLTSLRPGLRKYGYKVSLYVNISDTEGAVETCPLDVQVKEVRLSRSEMLAYSYRSHPQYVELFAAQDFNGVMQLVSSLTDLLDSDIDSEDDACPCPEGKRISVTEKAEIRNQLVSIMNEVTPMIDNTPSLAQGAATLNKLTQKYEVLTPESMRNSSSMMRTFADMINTTGTQKEQGLTVANEMLSIIDHLLVATYPSSIKLQYNRTFGDVSPERQKELESQRKETALLKQKTERALVAEVFGNIQEGLNQITIAILMTDIPDEIPVFLRGEVTSFLVGKMSRKTIFDSKFNITDGSIVTPSSASDLLANTTEDPVVIQLTSFPRAYHTWDNSAFNLRTSVVGLKLMTPEGKEIFVRDLKEDIEINMVLDPNNTRNEPPLVYVERDEDHLRIYNLTCKSPKDILILTPKMPDSVAQMVILMTYNRNSGSEIEYDRRIDITGVTADIQVPCDGNSYVGLLVYGMSKMGVRTSSFGLSVRTAACKYWSTNEEKWTTGDCKVGPKTTTSFVQCLCNHLTFFSSDLIVPPNTIDFDTVFGKASTELARNWAVLGTVIGILLAYYILLLILRKFDIMDEEKWRLRPLVDNENNDPYCYVLTVQTGHQASAGTESHVFFELCGDEGNSRTRVFNDGSVKNLFTSGSQRHFLMTEPRFLSDLTYLHIWHDNAGSYDMGSWFLNHITIKDLTTGKSYIFLCGRWLAVEMDDGEVRRILPGASEEELSSFDLVFNSTLRREMADDHLWFSLFWRPTSSTFTRVQRLSCCLSLLFTSMIASAMFYGRLEETEKSIWMSLGPISISPQQLYVATITTLIVFPVTFIIVILFRKSATWQQWEHRKRQTKFHPMTDEDERNIMSPVSARSADVYPHDILMESKVEKTTKPEYLLPPLCALLAYIFVFLSVVASGFFTVLYSIEWGKEKSEAWLASLFISMAQSICVIQPVKVVLVALFFALVIKKPKLEADTREVSDKKVKSTQVYIDSAGIPKPPDRTQLLHLRAQRLRERAMDAILRGLGLYLVYVCILWTIAYGHISRDMCGITTAVKNSLHGRNGGFKEVTTLKSLEEWLSTVLVDELYPISLYNGDETQWRQQTYSALTGDYIRVTEPRLRQLRVKPNGCVLNRLAKELFSECNTDYDFLDEDRNYYRPKWEPAVNKTDVIDNVTLSPWIYTPAKLLHTVPFLGHWDMYRGGGYVMELGTSRDHARKTIIDTLSQNWLNQYTRAVFVEFTLYNPNVNIFTVAHFLAEYRENSALVTSVQLDHVTLFDYNRTSYVLFLLCEIVYLLILLYQIICLIKALKAMGRSYWKIKWNLVELLLVLAGIGAVVMFGLRKVLGGSIISDFLENRHTEGVYFNFYLVAVYDKVFGYVLAFIVFLSTLKIFKFLSFNKRMYLIANTLTNAAAGLWSYSAVFATLYCAFGMLGNLWFGRNHLEFSSLIITLESQFAILLGGGEMKSMFRMYSGVGRFYYYSFSLIMLCVTLNLLLSILNEAFRKAKDDLASQPNEYEVVEYLITRFQHITGVKWMKQEEKKSAFEAESTPERFKEPAKRMGRRDRQQTRIGIKGGKKSLLGDTLQPILKKTFEAGDIGAKSRKPRPINVEWSDLN